MNREYRYITAINQSYQNKRIVWEEFITHDKYDPTQEYILVRNQIWIIYQLI